MFISRSMPARAKNDVGEERPLRALLACVLLGIALGAGSVAGAWALSERGEGDSAQDIVACATSQPTSGPSRPSTLATHVPRFSHVVVVVMENQECGDIIGNGAAPYINSLAGKYALATSFYAVTHPSLPNYLALTGGSTFGIRSDCTTCHVATTNLVDQLETAGLSWKAYMETMPSPCFRGAHAGLYAKKHDPFLYYDDISQNAARCAHVVPLDRLAVDLRRGELPAFAWITPNQCNDMHQKSCGVRAGDRFLAKLLPSVLRAVGSHGVVFLTWDEGPGSTAGCCEASGGGNVATIVAGPLAQPGRRSSVSYDHYSLLRTIEDGFGLPRLRRAGCPCTPSLTDLLQAS
jgi:hypothetical protein